MISEPIQRPTKENKFEFWKNLISELKNSNLTIDQFCQKNHISASTLYKWKNTIQGSKKSVVAKKKISSDDPSSSFIEVPVKKQNHFSGENINIIFPNGVKAILNKEIAASRLIEILQALGS